MTCCWFALLPPLSGEKPRHYTLAASTCMCAQWNLSNVGPWNSATDRHVCSTVQDNASSQRREAVDARLHCCLLCQVKSQGTMHLHPRVCAEWNLSNVGPWNSATDRHVCSTVQDNASSQRREAVAARLHCCVNLLMYLDENLSPERLKGCPSMHPRARGVQALHAPGRIIIYARVCGQPTGQMLPRGGT